MMQATYHSDEARVSYWQIRQAIGTIGICLPFLCILTVSLFGGQTPRQCCISHYYYTTAHIFFVGTLAVLGTLFLTYRGINKVENRFSNLAGLFAFMVIAFPTDFDGFQEGANTLYLQVNEDYISEKTPSISQIIHFSGAILLLISFAVFCLYFFQKGDIDSNPSDTKKARRNKIYKVNGVIILLGLLSCALMFLLKKRLDLDHRWPNFLFFFETICLIPFGISWLVKGSTYWYRSKFFLFRLLFPLLRNKPEVKDGLAK